MSRTQQFALLFIPFFLFLPLIFTPFWQDDLGMLSEAQRLSVWQMAFPEEKPPFFRPLSVALYWDVGESLFGINPLPYHLLNFTVFLSALALIAQFFLQLLKALGAARPVKGALLGTAIYGSHSAFTLPIAWASGSQELLSLFFTALFLLCFQGVIIGKRGNKPLTFAALLALLCALASKEGAVTAPALALVLAIWQRSVKGAALALLAGALAALWLGLRAFMVASGHPAYEITLGTNVLRNAAAFLLFALNVSREAIRFTLSDGSLLAFLWGAITAGVTALGWLWLWVSNGRPALSGAPGFLALWLLIGLAPYLALQWNCYPYYALLAFVALGLLGALLGSVRNADCRGAGLLFLGAVLSVAGEFALPYPAKLARADWSRDARAALALIQPPAAGPINVLVTAEGETYFAAVGWEQGIGLAQGLDPNRYQVYFQESMERGVTPQLMFTDEGMSR